MRLTLRTMLAFLDDVLEGPDAQELEQKIDESKFASDLVHRIRSSVRRLRLGAPKVVGRGIGSDANSVAEYLDNTMPTQQVPDFEKVCLESDVQLAEVAACHQILTTVFLGEPAAAEPSSRERMYRIGYPEDAVSRRAAEPHPASADGGEPEMRPVADEAENVASSSEAVELARTDAARSRGTSRDSAGPGESRIPWKSLAITLLSGFVVSAVALRAIAPFDTDHPVWRLFAVGRGPEVARQQAERRGDEVPAAPVPDAATGSVVVVPPAGDVVDSSRAVPVAGAHESVPAGDPAAPAPSAAPEPSVAPEPARPAVDLVQEAAGAAALVPPAKPGQPAAVEPESPASATGGPPRATATAAGDLAAPGPPPAAEPGKMATAAGTAVPGHVGRYISEEQILARIDPSQNAWMALAADTPLMAGERLMSLPAFRPQILLAPSVKITLAGEAFFRPQVPDVAGVPRLTLEFGRAVLIPVGETENALQIDFGGRGGRLTFTDNESVIVAEVRQYLPPGSDPLSEPASLVVQLWAISGGLVWQEPEQPAVPLAAGQRLQFIDEGPVAVVEAAPLPEWIDGKAAGGIERLAAQALREFLTTDRPLALSLMEQTNHRRVEVRALACRTLCYLDIFEPAIAAFADSQLKTYWPGFLAAIQSTMPFGQETVTKLSADLARLHGARADRILELLRGYSPDQLAAGGAAALVDALEDDLMAVRVIAFLTLQRITERTNLFRPEERPDQERPRVERWRRSLKEGQIGYRVPPSPLPRVGGPASP